MTGLRKYFGRFYTDSTWYLFSSLNQQNRDTGFEKDTLSTTAEDDTDDGNHHLAGRPCSGQVSSVWPSRILLGGWYLFSTIAVSTYTANLATFFVSAAIQDKIPFQSVTELPKQSEYKYGTVAGSAVERLFNLSTLEYYNEIYEAMMSQKDDVMVNSTDEGYRRVLNDPKYIFIWDTLALQYFINKDPGCTVRVIGQGFGESEYGFGMRKGMPFEDDFRIALLELRDEQRIANLSQTWFSTNGACSIRIDYSANEPDSVTLTEFLGVFLILIVSLGLSGIVRLVIWLHGQQNSAVKSDAETTRMLAKTQKKEDRKSFSSSSHF